VNFLAETNEAHENFQSVLLTEGIVPSIVLVLGSVSATSSRGKFGIVHACLLLLKQCLPMFPKPGYLWLIRGLSK
jgi:hypothetical protein